MSAQFGSAKIGAMQYSGLNIAEARYNGQVVFKAKPNLSPASLGAVHWLPFTNSPTENLGSSGGVWGELNTPAVTGGALTTGTVRNPSPNPYDPSNGCAFTGWVNTTHTLNNLQQPIKVTASYSELGFSFNGLTREAQWTFRRGGTSAQLVYGGTVPTGWVSVAACMEPVTGTTWRYRAYIGGSEVVNSTYNAGTQQAVTFAYATVNSSSAQLDDIAIYNRALTAQEILSLHQLGRSQ